ncbi:MAG TPA: hypothetical protein VML96_09175, partial [Egibacteraceae bacterium]|nr:hypothetical protein [Egibacteraceae bacterium]
REVFAVPGSINLPTSQAPLALLRDGAQPLTRLEDVLDALPAIGPTRLADPAGGIRAPLPPRLDPAASAVLDLLSATPSSPGRLAAAAGLPISQIMAAISELTRMGVAAATARGVVAAAGTQSRPAGPAPR